jgi:quercetin dioxygenase-like cupin family protein
VSVITTRKPGADVTQVIEEMAGQGFEAAVKDFAPGQTQPHHHDYDVCLHILEGEFKLAEVDPSIVHRFGPGDRVLVDRETVHAEEHGALRMIVGRRH